MKVTWFPCCTSLSITELASVIFQWEGRGNVWFPISFCNINPLDVVLKIQLFTAPRNNHPLDENNRDAHKKAGQGLTFCCFKQNPGLVDQYISTLLSLDQSPTTLAMLGMCLDFCTAQKDKASIEKHKVSFF